MWWAAVLQSNGLQLPNVQFPVLGAATWIGIAFMIHIAVAAWSMGIVIIAPTYELIGRRLQKLAEQLCDGSLTPLLTHLVRTRRLTPAERAELRALIEDEDTSSKKKRR